MLTRSSRTGQSKLRVDYGQNYETAVKSAEREVTGDAAADGGVHSAGAAGDITGKDFLTIFLMVITFYFGTQSQKAQDAMDAKGDGDGTEN